MAAWRTPQKRCDRFLQIFRLGVTGSTGPFGGLGSGFESWGRSGSEGAGGAIGRLGSAGFSGAKPRLRGAVVTDARPAAVVVLAAGEGTRMKSSTAKVLHPLGGRSMLGHVVTACRALEPDHL